MGKNTMSDSDKLDLILGAVQEMNKVQVKHGQDIDLLMAHLGLDDPREPAAPDDGAIGATISDGPEYYEEDIDATSNGHVTGRSMELLVEDDGLPPGVAEFSVRVKPYNQRLGQLVKNYTFGGFRYESPKWYIRDRATAAKLLLLKQNPEDPYSADVFDVVTEDERYAVEAEELGFSEAGDARNPIRGAQRAQGRLIPPGRIAHARRAPDAAGSARRPVRQRVPARANGAPVNEGRSMTALPE